jgi:hypothetical protein
MAAPLSDQAAAIGHDEIIALIIPLAAIARITHAAINEKSVHEQADPIDAGAGRAAPSA